MSTLTLDVVTEYVRVTFEVLGTISLIFAALGWAARAAFKAGDV